MRVISRKRLKDFAARFPDAKLQLDAWYHEARKAKWKTPAAIKDKYRSASILKSGRVVLKYRMIVKISFVNGKVLIRFVGTHAEYDDVNAEEV